MDVLKSENLGGQELKETLVSLTDLPAPLVHEELDQILAVTGQESSSLTLDSLRAAMLTYLESIHDQMTSQESSDDAWVAAEDTPIDQ